MKKTVAQLWKFERAINTISIQLTLNKIQHSPVHFDCPKCNRIGEEQFRSNIRGKKENISMEQYVVTEGYYSSIA